jgi:hypothetical protein
MEYVAPLMKVKSVGLGSFPGANDVAGATRNGGAACKNAGEF